MCNQFGQFSLTLRYTAENTTGLDCPAAGFGESRKNVRASALKIKYNSLNGSNLTRFGFGESRSRLLLSMNEWMGISACIWHHV